MSVAVQEWLALGVVAGVALVFARPLVRAAAMFWARRLLRKGQVARALRWRAFAEGRPGDGNDCCK